MKRVLFVAFLACTVGLPAAYAQARQGHVWVSGTAPLVIRGSGFKAHESVRVVVFLEKATKRTSVATTPAGRFAARFGVGASGCGIKKITARGSLGTRASWTVPAQSCGAKAIVYPE